MAVKELLWLQSLMLRCLLQEDDSGDASEGVGEEFGVFMRGTASKTFKSHA